MKVSTKWIYMKFSAVILSHVAKFTIWTRQLNLEWTLTQPLYFYVIRTKSKQNNCRYLPAYALHCSLRYFLLADEWCFRFVTFRNRCSYFLFVSVFYRCSDTDGIECHILSMKFRVYEFIFVSTHNGRKKRLSLLRIQRCIERKWNFSDAEAHARKLNVTETDMDMCALWLKSSARSYGDRMWIEQQHCTTNMTQWVAQITYFIFQHTASNAVECRALARRSMCLDVCLCECDVWLSS